MKKLLFIAAAAAGMAAVADVTSANTVGYTQIEIKPGLNMIGTAFLKVDTNGRPDLQATFSDAKGKAKAGMADDEADLIQVYDSTKKSYPNQFYFYAPENPEDADPDYDYKWCSNKDDEPTDFVIPSANAFWYWSRGEKDFALTTSGAVGAESIQVTIKPGLNMIVNPFPCALPLNSDAANWKDAGVKTGMADDEADLIQVYDSTKKSYPNQFYFYAPENPEDADPDYDFKWCSNKDDEPTDFAIPAGGGFWYWSRNEKDITITFKTPLAK